MTFSLVSDKYVGTDLSWAPQDVVQHRLQQLNELTRSYTLFFLSRQRQVCGNGPVMGSTGCCATSTATTQRLNTLTHTFFLSHQRQVCGHGPVMGSTGCGATSTATTQRLNTRFEDILFRVGRRANS